MPTQEEQAPTNEFQQDKNFWQMKATTAPSHSTEHVPLTPTKANVVEGSSFSSSSPTSELAAPAKELKQDPCNVLDFSVSAKTDEQKSRAPSFSGPMIQSLITNTTENLPAVPAPASTTIVADVTPVPVAEPPMPFEEPTTPPSCLPVEHDFEDDMNDSGISSSPSKEEPLSMASVFKSISEFKEQKFKDFDFSLRKDMKFGSYTTGNSTAAESSEASPSSTSSTSSTNSGTSTLTETFSFPDMSGWKEKMMNIGNTNASAPNSNASTNSTTTTGNMKSPFGSLSWMPKSLTSPTGSIDSSTSTESNTKKNIHCPNSKRLVQAPGVGGSPYGELLVVEVLGAKDLAVGDFFQGESDPYVNIRFKGVQRKTEVVKGTVNPVYNQRFAFWCSQAPDKHNDLVSMTFMNKNLVIADELLGEIHFTLDIPLNITCDGWFPLMKENGEYKGKVRIGMRRMVIPSPAVLLVAQTLSSNECSINDTDLAKHGSVVPELWYGFSNAEEPLEKENATDVLANKFTEFSRRFMGKEETTADGLRRDVF